MPRIELTRELAWAASMDAGNRAMRAAGRKSWTEEDSNAAWREFNRLWPLCTHKAERGCCPFSGCCNADDPLGSFKSFAH
jgi:hypothetical protein